MKCVAYTPTVFKTFVGDFKALASSLEKIQDGFYFKAKLLDAKFIMAMLFLSDLNSVMALGSKLVQTSNSNLPCAYSDDINWQSFL